MSETYKNTEQLEKLLQEFIDYNISFVSFRIPESSIINVFVFAENNISVINTYRDINKNGFVFYPFEANENSPGLFIEPSLSFNNETIPTDFDLQFWSTEKQHSSKADIIPEKKIKEQYFTAIDEILNQIKSGKVEKVVLSRPKFIENFSIKNTSKLFIESAKKYKNAFVYLLNIAGKMMWMGASPEILLESKADKFKTIALAGTSAKENLAEINWTQKEIHEQKLVSDFIIEVLKKHKVEKLKQVGPTTVKAGKLHHIKSDFTFESSQENYSKIAFDLHPTPAVCGLPQDIAKQIILKVENYNRQYYSGFLGLVDNHSCNFYVNLRCMQFLNNGILLYAGGGITIGSDAKSEWNETESKTKTLLSVIEKIS